MASCAQKWGAGAKRPPVTTGGQPATGHGRKPHHFASLTAGLTILALSAGEVRAQKLGTGGTMVDGAQEIPRCTERLGTVALVKEKATARATLPPQFQTLMDMA